MSIFQYEFMQRAFLVGACISLIIPCMGTIVVLKRHSMIGDALSHMSLAGVLAGLLIGINPIAGSVIACVTAGISIEWLRKKFPAYAEISIAIIMSLGIGLAGVLSGFFKGSTNIDSFLFGSIVLIDNFELILILCVSFVVLLSFLLLYKELFLIVLDERLARLSGVRVSVVNTIFTILTALTVAIAARTVGALIVSSLMVIPVAISMQWAKSYKQTVIYASIISLCITLGGLFLSYYLNLKPGGTIVLLGIAVLLCTFMVKAIIKKCYIKRENNK